MKKLINVCSSASCRWLDKFRWRASLVLFLGLSAFCAGAADKPNVVLLFIDDLNFSDVKDAYDLEKFPAPWRYGHTDPYAQPARKSPVVVSPNIDKLAQESIIFDRFYVTSSVCTPSRYSLLTGQYASQSYTLAKEKMKPGQGVKPVSFNTHIHRDQYTLPQMFKSVGYTTGLVGKLHAHDTNIAEIKSTYVKYNKMKKLTPEALAEIKANYERFVEGIRRDYPWDFAERIYCDNSDASYTPHQLRYFNMDWCTESALDFIDAQKENPFFLYYAINLPHGVNAPGHMQAMENRASPMGILEKNPGVIPTVKEICERITEAGGDPQESAVPTMIDAVVGVIDQKLKEADVYDNTILIFLSDHQAMAKQYPYEGSHVPCFIRWPESFSKSFRTDALVANIDVLPTLAELVGGTVPEDVVVDGKSFAPLLRGDSGFKGRDSLMLEVEYGRAMVEGSYKYIEFFAPTSVKKKIANKEIYTNNKGAVNRVGWQGYLREAPQMFPHYYEAVQLYNLASDPLEQSNLMDNPEYHERAKRMRGDVMNHIERCRQVQKTAAKAWYQ